MQLKAQEIKYLQQTNTLFTIFSDSKLEDESSSPIIQATHLKDCRKSQKSFSYSKAVTKEQQDKLESQNQSGQQFSEKQAFLLKKYSSYKPKGCNKQKFYLQSKLRNNKEPNVNYNITLEEKKKIEQINQDKSEIQFLFQKQRQYKLMKENLINQWKKSKLPQKQKQNKNCIGQTFLSFQQIEQKEKEIQQKMHYLIMKIQKDQGISKQFKNINLLLLNQTNIQNQIC